MKIAVYGDSWTEGYGLSANEKCWPEHLADFVNCKIFKKSKSGADNESILDDVKSTVDKVRPDLIIIGWSGVTRIRHSKWPFYKQYSLSWVPTEHSSHRIEYFKNSSLENIASRWRRQINEAVELAKTKKCKLINFSVFGDQHIINDNKMIDISPLEFIASLQGHSFKYDIPIFEFDFLNENNTVTYEFAERNFPEHWDKACAEREAVREGSDQKYFMNCGHPRSIGYKSWAEYLARFI